MESTISIWREYSVSSRGPFHRTSTPKSRSASRTPACTDMKNKCEVALGTTPMSFLVRFCQELASTRANSSATASHDLDCIANAQDTLSGLQFIASASELCRDRREQEHKR